MFRFTIKIKLFLSAFFIYLAVLLIISDLCPGAELIEENKSDEKEIQYRLDKEEAMLWALLNCVNEDGTAYEEEFIKSHVPKNRRNRNSSVAKNSAVRAELGNEEQLKNKKKRTHYQLGYQYAQEGDYLSAISQFEMILKYDILDKNSYYNLGYLYAKIGRYEDAVKAYHRALQLSRDPNDGQIYYNLALIYDSGLKDKEKSRQYYEKFLDASNIFSERKR
ncbi:MAG: tetratricopeptide repeat protein [Candidatus Omnitrophica bacterium]|nr:tetratricopeptide repeat protein [Candidatus Omnitrophota bacterium]MBU4479255.1 tetratricopeptide repeat protein [Candidatus Omnitrophota bacterium]MCG2703069.1 tetratricopeptide repeat protein [Candidatus Omnitrophota bacterium]